MKSRISKIIIVFVAVLLCITGYVLFLDRGNMTDKEVITKPDAIIVYTPQKQYILDSRQFNFFYKEVNKILAQPEDFAYADAALNEEFIKEMKNEYSFELLWDDEEQTDIYWLENFSKLFFYFDVDDSVYMIRGDKNKYFHGIIDSTYNSKAIKRYMENHFK